MFCDVVTQSCRYKTCPAAIPHGTVWHEDDDHADDYFGSFAPVTNGIADKAFISCDEGFNVKHPNNLVGIARGQHDSISDRRLRVQCNEVDGTARWYISYRSSSSLEDRGAPDDVYHVSRVAARCERGCVHDTQCPVRERCYKGQCVPKTCSDDLGRSFAHAVLLWARSRNEGTVDRAKCQYGYVREDYGVDFPFSVECAAGANPRYDPEWRIHPDAAVEIRCVRRDPCTADGDCGSEAQGSRKEACLASGELDS